MMNNITISEYGYLGCDNESVENDKYVGYRSLLQSEFSELITYRNQNADTEKIFTRVNPKCIKATSFVGIIQTENLSIEILPKIYKGKKDDEAVEKDKHRNIFIQMLKPLLNINNIQINRANLSTTQSKNIYEKFITIFIEYMNYLLHRGLKSDYISQENNQHFLKGKLKFNEHIRENYIHKERFYVEYDEYLTDRVENRLLKSAIELLIKKTVDSENKKHLRQLLFIFDDVRSSNNYDNDFMKSSTNRGMEDYIMPLRFAEVFLKHKSFTSLRGDDNVFALLFPMEKVFENYIEFVLENSKDILGIKKVRVNGYNNDYLLSGKLINQEPDYLLEMKDTEKKPIITDAKWKLIETKELSNGDTVTRINSGDAYQIFSYLHYYDSQNTAYVFAPTTETIEIESNSLSYLQQGGKETDKKIKIIPIDLQQLINNGHRFNEQILNS